MVLSHNINILYGDEKNKKIKTNLKAFLPFILIFLFFFVSINMKNIIFCFFFYFELQIS